MTKKIGYNVMSVPDRPRLYAHAHAMQPPAMLFYSHMGNAASELAAEFPKCAVILRSWPDGSEVLLEAPDKWLDRVSKGAPDNLYLYTCNEVGWSSTLIKWHVDVMKLAIQRKRRLCILNMGVGQPGPTNWAEAKELLTLASQHRDLFIIGLHEYSGAVITSGLIGGDPKFIQPDTWPSPLQAKALTRWHSGRMKFLTDYCKEIGIQQPRIVITEAGFDFTGDIGTWLNHLRFTPPNKSINGWKTLVDQWRDWWPTWSAQEAYAKQMLWAEDALWTDAEGVLLFGWGDSGGWGAYDVSASIAMQGLFENAPSVPPPVEIPTPPVIIHPPVPVPVPLPPPPPTNPPPVVNPPALTPEAAKAELLVHLRAMITLIENWPKAA